MEASFLDKAQVKLNDPFAFRCEGKLYTHRSLDSATSFCFVAGRFIVGTRLGNVLIVNGSSSEIENFLTLSSGSVEVARCMIAS